MSKRSADTMDDTHGNDNASATSNRPDATRAIKRVPFQPENVFMVFNVSEKGSQWTRPRVLGTFPDKISTLDFMMKYACRVVDITLNGDEPPFKHRKSFQGFYKSSVHFTGRSLMTFPMLILAFSSQSG